MSNPLEVLRCLETLALTPPEFLDQRPNELETVREFVAGVPRQDEDVVSDNPKTRKRPRVLVQ